MNENVTPKSGGAILKVTRIGDSLGVVLPLEVVERLGLRDGDQLRAQEGADGSVEFSALTTRDRTLQAARRVMDTYAETFRILAK